MAEQPISRPDEYFSLYRDRHPDASACFAAPAAIGEPAVISAAGVLDSETSPDFLEAALAILERLPVASVLELRLEGVRFISSTGVGALTRLLAAANGRGVSLRVSGVSPVCEDVFSVLGLLDYFDLSGTGPTPARE